IDSQNPHHRGSGRIRDPRRQPEPGEALNRAYLLQRVARFRAPGPRRHHGRRGARCRDRQYRDPRGAHWPLGAHHAAHRERCGGTGYRGRSGVFECLEMTEPVRKLIGSTTDTGVVEEAAIEAGMTMMIEDAVAKCRAGVTSAAEVLRVTTVR